jgi:hypothetical protein
MSNRKDFIKQVLAVGALSAIPDVVLSQVNSFSLQQNDAKDKIWACLLHLSHNMWVEYSTPTSPFRGYRPYLQLNETVWTDVREKMAKEGMNMVLIDLGDAIKYESHPEIAVNQAWSTTRLKDELAKFRKMGIEPIPKLNFAAGHDTWLGKYSRMVSTEPYYQVCKDLIAEVIELFDKPRFFHLGMDEENAEDQRYHDLITVRQHDLWWHDFYFLVDQVEKGGSRAWIWSDYMWKNSEVFFKKMPKSVVQSNWYYEETYDETNVAVKAYKDLEAHGYDQIPTGGFYKNNPKNIMSTVQYCDRQIPDYRLLGFLQTFWKPNTEEFREQILTGIELTGDAKKWFEKNHKTNNKK